MRDTRRPIADNPCKECLNDYREKVLLVDGRIVREFTRKSPSLLCCFCIPPEFSRFESETGRELEEIMYGTRTQVQKVQDSVPGE